MKDHQETIVRYHFVHIYRMRNACTVKYRSHLTKLCDFLYTLKMRTVLIKIGKKSNHRPNKAILSREFALYSKVCNVMV